MAGGGQANLTNTSDKNEVSPAWSADGTRIAYFEGFNGLFNLWVMDANGANASMITTTSAYPCGSTPTWSPGLFFRQGLAGPATPVILGRMSFAERSLRVQYQIARALAESASLHDAAPLVLRAICETLDWELGLLWRVDPSADELRFVDLWRAPSVHVERFEQVSRDRSFARDVGLPGRVWASGKPAWIPDVAQDTNFPRARLAAECGLHAGFAFPIRLGDETLGVFEFFARVIRPPDEVLLTRSWRGSVARSGSSTNAAEPRLPLPSRSGDWQRSGFRGLEKTSHSR